MHHLPALIDFANPFADCPSHLHYDFDSGSCVSKCPCGFIGFDYHSTHYCQPGTIIAENLLRMLELFFQMQSKIFKSM